MERHVEPSTSDEISSLDAWDRTLWLSRAYLEAASCLCSSILDGEFTSQYSSSRVILHLTRHGIELFLKGAMHAAGKQTSDLRHNLDKLFLRYRQHYVSPSFHFEIPSRFQVNVNTDLFPKSIDTFHETLDQRHRYATDKSGQSFATPETFDPGLAQKEIEQLRRALGVIEWVELRPWVSSRKTP